MANSELYNKTFKIPDKILNHIEKNLVRYPNVEGIKRAKHILKNKELTYQALKRIKNFFDNYNPTEKDIEAKFELAGGRLMNDFVEKTLSTERSGTKRRNDTKNMLDRSPNSDVKPHRMIEGVDIENRNVIAIIINNNGRVLLCKRSPKTNWGANKWAYVGGSLQQGENIIDGCKREIKEECGIDVIKIKNIFNLQRLNHKEEFDYVFVAKYDGGEDEIKLNGEHINYGWFNLNDVKSMEDKAPNIYEYLLIAFKSSNK